MDKKIVFTLVSGIVIAQQFNEAVHVPDAERLVATLPSVQAPPVYALPHSTDPEDPTGPLRTLWTVAQRDELGVGEQLNGTFYRAHDSVDELDLSLAHVHDVSSGSTTFRSA